MRRAGGVASASVPAAAEHFHGDGAAYGEVDVVWPDRLLGGYALGAGTEGARERSFGLGYAELPALPGAGALFEAFGRIDGAAARGVCGGCVAAALLGSTGGGQDPVGGGAAARLDATTGEVGGDAASPDAVLARELRDGCSGQVALHEVVRVSRRPFSGHVFNLQTGGGWYTANGMIVHNCRCRPVPKTIGWDEIDPALAGIENTTVDLTPGPELFRGLSPAQRRKVLGPGKAALYEAGAIDLPDLVQVTAHPWGMGRRSKSLRELRAEHRQGQ